MFPNLRNDDGISTLVSLLHPLNMSGVITEPVTEPVIESVIDFVPLLHFEKDYEILNQYPFTIRKKSNKRICY